MKRTITYGMLILCISTMLYSCKIHKDISADDNTTYSQYAATAENTDSAGLVKRKIDVQRLMEYDFANDKYIDSTEMDDINCHFNLLIPEAWMGSEGFFYTDGTRSFEGLYELITASTEFDVINDEFDYDAFLYSSGGYIIEPHNCTKTTGVTANNYQYLLLSEDTSEEFDRYLYMCILKLNDEYITLLNAGVEANPDGSESDVFMKILDSIEFAEIT